MATEITISWPRRRQVRIAFAAACWALIFGIIHILWAVGWYVGLDPEKSREAFAKPWFLAYDIIVAGMCILAVPIALALGMTWGQRIPRKILNAVAWTATSLLVLRAMASLLQAAYLLLTNRFNLQQMSIWEPWFYVGAMLFCLNLWQYSGHTRSRAA